MRAPSNFMIGGAGCVRQRLASFPPSENISAYVRQAVRPEARFICSYQHYHISTHNT